MWLILLRIVFGFAALAVVREAWDNAQAHPSSGDMVNAGLLVVLGLLALANAAVWAPFLGARLSEPVTNVLTTSTYVDRTNHVLRILVWLDARGSRRLATWVALFEGLRHPNLPTAYLLGLRNARRGSYFEWLFARDLWQFDNIQNCAAAYRALRRHGIDPRPHRNPEVNLALMAQERAAVRERPRVEFPRSTLEGPAPQRDFRIRLFDGDRPASVQAAAGDSSSDAEDANRRDDA